VGGDLREGPLRPFSSEDNATRRRSVAEGGKRNIEV